MHEPVLLIFYEVKNQDWPVLLQSFDLTHVFALV